MGDWQPMGHAVREALGDDFYVMGFLAHHGTIGGVSGWSRPLEPAPSGTLDALCHDTGQPHLFVDLRTLPDRPGGGWLRETLTARPRGYAPMRADWSRVVDAMFFSDEMVPSTRVSE